jgi:hypothetical protein
MIKVYLDDNEIFAGDLGRSLTNIVDIVANINTRFGVNGWTSFQYFNEETA